MARELPDVIACLLDLDHEARAVIAAEINECPKASDVKVWLQVLDAQSHWIAWAQEKLPYERALPLPEPKAVLVWLDAKSHIYRNSLKDRAFEVKTAGRLDALQRMDRMGEVFVTWRRIVDLAERMAPKPEPTTAE